jgi:hypothetical protein
MNFKKMLVLVAVFAAIAFGQVETFVREYTYFMNNDDSRNSARNRALEHLRTELLREIGSLVHASYSSSYVLSGSETVDDNYREAVKIITQGKVGLKILEEKWEGMSYFVRAEMTVNVAEVRANLEKVQAQLREDQQRKQTEPQTAQVTSTVQVVQIVRAPRAPREKKKAELKVLEISPKDTRGQFVKESEKTVKAKYENYRYRVFSARGKLFLTNLNSNIDELVAVNIRTTNSNDFELVEIGRVVSKVYSGFAGDIEIGRINKNGLYNTLEMSLGFIYNDWSYIGGGFNIGKCFNTSPGNLAMSNIVGGSIGCWVYGNYNRGYIDIHNGLMEYYVDNNTSIYFGGPFHKLMFGKTKNIDITSKLLFGFCMNSGYIPYHHYRRDGWGQWRREASAESYIFRSFAMEYSLSIGYTMVKFKPKKK